VQHDFSYSLTLTPFYHRRHQRARQPAPAMLRLAIDIEDHCLRASVNRLGARQQLAYHQPAAGDYFALPLREPSEEALLRYHLSQEEH
jgi:hypothetical protein